MYRFVLTPRWIALGLGMTLAAAVMVGLGLWQLDRYGQRRAINDRVDAAVAADPVPLASVLGIDAAPTAQQAWTKVSVTGRYDSAHEILARARTVDGQVGFEILTPVVLNDGTAVIVDRGWLAPRPESASIKPEIPPVPTGPVTVVGLLHLPESKASAPEPFDGTLAVRRIGPAELRSVLPYRVYQAYVTLDNQDPPASQAFVPIPPDHVNAAMNAGYVVQWWMFAGLTLFGYVYLVHREAKERRTPQPSVWDQLGDQDPDPDPSKVSA
jgi:cytochrome oxidase assembly protein ShyY1